jgi:hypothetical protein
LRPVESIDRVSSISQSAEYRERERREREIERAEQSPERLAAEGARECEDACCKDFIIPEILDN